MGAILKPFSDLFGWLMSFFYNFISGTFTEPQNISYFAITMILMACISRMLTIPLMAQTTKSQQKMTALQPKMAELQKKYGYDERIMQQKTQELYREEGVSMMGCSSCLPTLLQFILIFALFEVLRNPEAYLGQSVSNFASIRKDFFWIENLLGPDPLSWVGLPLLNMLLQIAVMFFNPQRQQQEQMAKGMSMTLMIMPVLFYFFSINWASGLLLYWVFSSVFDLIYRGIVKLVTMRRVPKEA